MPDDASPLKELAERLKSIRKNLPYDDTDPARNRKAGVEQMRAIATYLRAQGIDASAISPFQEILSSVEKLEEGERTLLTSRPVQKPYGDKLNYAILVAAVDFVAYRKNKKEAAKKVLGFYRQHIKKNEFGSKPLSFIAQKSTNKNDGHSKEWKDQKPEEETVVEWASACRNGRNGAMAQKTYFRTLEFLEENHKATGLSREDVVKQLFEISAEFEDLSNILRVKRPPIR